MVRLLKSAWSEVFEPLLRRPPALQVAALCYRKHKSGIQILLVTSTNGRWILPKGWPIDGLLAHQAALQEAWEEAGVKKGAAETHRIGSFESNKSLGNGVEVPCRTFVYPVEVKAMSQHYPEEDRRERKWVNLAVAADKVDEPGLRPIIHRFASRF